jgi:hypothetical protein
MSLNAIATPAARESGREIQFYSRLILLAKDLVLQGLSSRRRRDSNPDTRIMIPRDFGLAIGHLGPVGHAFGHNRIRGWTPLRVGLEQRALRRHDRRGRGSGRHPRGGPPAWAIRPRGGGAARRGSQRAAARSQPERSSSQNGSLSTGVPRCEVGERRAQVAGAVRPSCAATGSMLSSIRNCSSSVGRKRFISATTAA